MSICFNFYLLTNFSALDVYRKLLIFHHWKFFEWWSFKIYDIRRDERIKKLLYYTKKKRALSHVHSACDEDFYFILCLLYFCFSKKKLCCKINRKCNSNKRQTNKYLKKKYKLSKGLTNWCLHRILPLCCKINRKCNSNTL